MACFRMIPTRRIRYGETKAATLFRPNAASCSSWGCCQGLCAYIRPLFLSRCIRFIASVALFGGITFVCTVYYCHRRILSWIDLSFTSYHLIHSLSGTTFLSEALEASTYTKLLDTSTYNHAIEIHIRYLWAHLRWRQLRHTHRELFLPAVALFNWPCVDD